MYSTDATTTGLTIKLGVGIIITDPQARVLLERRSDNGLWGLPGGGVDPGESIVEAAVREAREETSLEIEVISLLGIYSELSGGRIVTYPDNGDVKHSIDVILIASIRSGELSMSPESIDLDFFTRNTCPAPDEIAHPARQPLTDYWADRTAVVR